MFGKFFAKQKRIFLCAFGWPVSRVLSFKMIINLDMALLPCSSGHGNGRTAHMFQHLAPHGVYSELLSPIFRVSSYLTFSPLPFSGCIFLLHFSSGCPGLTLSSVIVLWCSDFPHRTWRRNHPTNGCIIHLFIFCVKPKLKSLIQIVFD